MNGPLLLDTQAGPVQVRDSDGQLAVMASVYSVPFTETNDVFDAYRFPRHLYSTTATRAQFDEHLLQLGAAPLPELGERKLGLLDLVHEPLLDAVLGAAAGLAPGLDDAAARPWRYPLHGSASGIGLLLGHLKHRLHLGEIRVLAGDYEGYAAQAASYGLACRAGTLEEMLATSGDTWFVSNPSARDGVALDDAVVAEAARRHRLVLDVAYLGLAGRHPVAVPEDTWAVLWSLSKPWGLFWKRVGALACAEEVPGAYSTRWFKDPERLAAALAVVSRHDAAAMSERYRFAQHAALEALAQLGVQARASDTLLLVLAERDGTDPALWAELAHAERVPGSGVSRVCVTPLVEQLALRP